jgi:hypothetical protein
VRFFTVFSFAAAVCASPLAYAQDTPAAAEEPAAEALAAEAPADEAPADEAPADEAPADEAPADEAPAQEESAPPAPVSDDAPADEAPDAEEAPVEEKAPYALPRNPDVPTSLCPEDKPCVQAAGFAVWPHSRLRAGFEYVMADQEQLLVGHNDGFFLDQVRLGVNATWERRFLLRLTVELASVLPGGKSNDPLQPTITAARDAYLMWTPSDYVQVTVGQTYMPFDVEGMTSRTELFFTGRSVATGGIRAGRGYEVDGLAPDRQIGIVVGAPAAPVGPVALDYRLAISNGNDANHLGNDNKLPAAWARVGAGLKEWVSGGLAASWNPRTVGEVPNLFSETHLSFAGDLRLDVFGIDVLAQGIFRRVSFDTAFADDADPAAADHSVGVTSWIVLDEPFGLPMFGFKPGYRFSYYDPYFSDPDDGLMEHTFGVRYDPPTPVPFAVMLDATLLFEDAELAENPDSARYLDNHRIVALVQFDL